MDQSAHTIAVVEKPEAKRYELLVDGLVAGIEQYADRGGVRALTHTEVHPRYEGMGLARRLVAEVLDDIRGRGMTVDPQCRYVTGFLERNPQYRDLLARA
jgi:predicted GNAT family acetyltransferase